MNDRDEARTLAGDAYAAIHQAIRTGSLRPGQRLRFAELQSLCRMSVSPVREALARKVPMRALQIGAALLFLLLGLWMLADLQGWLG